MVSLRLDHESVTSLLPFSILYEIVKKSFYTVLTILCVFFFTMTDVAVSDFLVLEGGKSNWDNNH